jgi:hypothetical protein
VPARDPFALRDALLGLPGRRGRRYADPHSWTQTTQAYTELIETIRSGVSPSHGESSESPTSAGAEQP